ncbi:MAG TPA: alpha-xylosidase [Opitutaceae bacterium]|nr:alpha-xylosidase [Opitutaceae bacterium]
MKFTDGNWLLQKGVTAHYPAEAHDAAVSGRGLVFHAPVRPIRHRGDTLQGPLLTVRIDSPMTDVIRVRIEHFTGAADAGPHIPLYPEKKPKVSIKVSDKEAILKSGDLSAHVQRGKAWGVSFQSGGRTLTGSVAKSMGYIEWPGHGNFVHEQLTLGVGECVYGLGERFTAFVKNGQVVENWNMDGGTSSDQAYKSVPFYMTNRGYGVLVNETGPVSFEVASEKLARVQFSIKGESLEYFVINGPDPKAILSRLTALTGRPALPPAWSFGLWLTTSFTTSYDEKTATSFIEGMKSRDLPLSVFHFDCFWMREFDWCNFEWDDRVFPDPAGMLKRLHARGLRVCLWINPYIAQRSSLFSEGASKGYFLKRTDGSVWQWDMWQPGMAIVDFTNPAAKAWFQSHLRRLAKMGVDSFKSDFGERIPTDVVYHDGSDPVKMHNHYAVLYNEAVFELLEEERGKGEALVFARSSHASGQRLPVHWGGDCHSTFESMAESLRGGLSLGMCGFGFWSHDIGGFEGTPPVAVYKRWIAFGLMSSHSRLHGSSSYRVPWNYDDEACDVLRFFTKLKCRLMPYLFSKAVEAHENGWPVMRAMILEFPGSPASDTLERQYMLGDSILVAPVFMEDGSVDYYLPEGVWTHITTGEVQQGGRWHHAKYGFLGMPLFARANRVIAFGLVDDKPDYNYADRVTFRVYALEDGKEATAVVTDQKGKTVATITVRRKGRTIEASLEGTAKNWKLQLMGISGVNEVDGGIPSKDPLGTVISTGHGSRSIKARLHAEK